MKSVHKEWSDSIMFLFIIIYHLIPSECIHIYEDHLQRSYLVGHLDQNGVGQISVPVHTHLNLTWYKRPNEILLSIINSWKTRVCSLDHKS